MITQNPCGILLKMIYIISERAKKSFKVQKLISIIDKIQEENDIFVYDIFRADKTDGNLLSPDLLKDLSILKTSGNVANHHSELMVEINLNGILTARQIEIPMKIKEPFLSALSEM